MTLPSPRFAQAVSKTSSTSVLPPLCKEPLHLLCPFFCLYLQGLGLMAQLLKQALYNLFLVF